jgi:hypothetical protein
MRNSKKRGGGHRAIVSGLCSFFGVDLAAQDSRTGGLSGTVTGGVVPPGSIRLWASLPGQPFRPFDRYETSALDVEATPVLDASLTGGQTVVYYLEYRDAQGELLCTSDTLSVDFPSD